LAQGRKNSWLGVAGRFCVLPPVSPPVNPAALKAQLSARTALLRSAAAFLKLRPFFLADAVLVRSGLLPLTLRKPVEE
jgi:hypothetical protein